jgi:hypothetical protein
MGDRDHVSAAEWMMQVISLAVNDRQPQLSDRDFTVHTNSSTLHSVTDLRAALARLGEPPRSISVCFGMPFSGAKSAKSGTVSQIQLIMSRPIGSRRLGGTLFLTGADADETHGFFSALCNEIGSAIAQGTQSDISAKASLWKRVVNHQYSVQIVGGITATLLATGILAWHPWS